MTRQCLPVLVLVFARLHCVLLLYSNNYWLLFLLTIYRNRNENHSGVCYANSLDIKSIKIITFLVLYPVPPGLIYVSYFFPNYVTEKWCLERFLRFFIQIFIFWTHWANSSFHKKELWSILKIDIKINDRDWVGQCSNCITQIEINSSQMGQFWVNDICADR